MAALVTRGCGEMRRIGILLGGRSSTVAPLFVCVCDCKVDGFMESCDLGCTVSSLVSRASGTRSELASGL